MAKQLTEKTKERILHLIKKNGIVPLHRRFTYMQIAKRFKVSAPTVGTLARKFKDGAL